MKLGVKYSKSELVLLLYRLSLKVDINKSREFAKKVIKISFAMGTPEEGFNYVSQIINAEHPKNKEELYACIIYNIALKQYDKALCILNQTQYKEWSDEKFFKIIRLICLERCSFLTQFLSDLNNLRSELNREEKSLLSIFEITANVHLNYLKVAAKIFQNCLNHYKETDAFPYILRLATNLFEPTESINFVEQAYSIFSERDDAFGMGTTIANKGLLELEMKNYNSALRLLKEGKDILRLYGTQHLNIIENNLGLSELFLDNKKDALKHFQKSIEFSTTPMPILYGKINIAILETLCQNFSKAIDVMESIYEDVITHKVDRVRQRYFSNFAVIITFSNKSNEEKENAITQMRKYLDRRYPHRTVDIANKLEKIIKRENSCKLSADFFFPCYLEYWYSNPLNSLKLKGLSY